MDEKSGMPPPPYSEANSQQYPPQQAHNPAYPAQQFAPPPQQHQYAPPQQQHPSYAPQQQGAYPPQQQQPYPPQTSQPQPYGQKQVPPPYSQPGYMPQQPGYPPQQPGAFSQNTTNTTTVIMSAPVPSYQQRTIAIGEIPPSYMWLSWLVCLFCCWPLGLAAIIASSRVDSAISNGNLAEARAQSSRAKSYAVAGVVCGIIIIALLIVRFTVLVSTYKN